MCNYPTNKLLRGHKTIKIEKKKTNYDGRRVNWENFYEPRYGKRERVNQMLRAVTMIKNNVITSPLSGKIQKICKGIFEFMT